jgi:hypothetical protein
VSFQSTTNVLFTGINFLNSANHNLGETHWCSFVDWASWVAPDPLRSLPPLCWWLQRCTATSPRLVSCLTASLPRPAARAGCSLRAPSLPSTQAWASLPHGYCLPSPPSPTHTHTHTTTAPLARPQFDNISVIAPGESHNTDAVDVHGQPFYIHDSHLSVGDDNIAAHVNDTLVEDCYFGTGHGASIGSIGNGYVQNVTFRYGCCSRAP